MNLFTSYDLIITPLSDIHIGTGRTLLPYEYTVKNGYYYEIDTIKIYKQLNSDQKQQFSKFAEKNMVDLRKFVMDVYKEEMGYNLKMKASSNLINSYNSKIGGARNRNEESMLAVAEMPYNSQGIYIPGSTVKGSIRGAYLQNILEGKLDYQVRRKPNKVKTPYVVSKFRDNQSAALDKEYQELALGEKVNPNNDPFRNIKISDSNFFNQDIEVKEVRNYSYSNDSQTFKSGPPVFAMVINGNLDYKNKINSQLKIEKNFQGKTKKGISKEELLDALDEKFKLIIKEELKFYEDMLSRTRHSKEVVEDILEFYRDLDYIYNKELNPDTQSIIRFGKGAGFNSTTYNLSLDENNRARIASRTISEDFSPMGWAVIEFQEK